MFPDIEKEKQALDKMLCEGIEIVGFYCSYMNGDTDQLGEHFLKLEKRLSKDLVAAYFSSSDAFVNEDCSSLVKWMGKEGKMIGKLGYENDTIKNFQKEFVSVSLCAELQTGDEIDAEKVAYLIENRVYTLDELGGRQVSHVFASDSSSERGGLDFSRRIDCLYRVEGVNADHSCPELTLKETFEEEKKKTFHGSAVGYFLPSTLISDAIKAMMKKLTGMRSENADSVCHLQPSSSVPVALAAFEKNGVLLDGNELSLRSGLPERVFDAKRDAKVIWKEVSKRLVNVHEEILNDHGLKDAKVSMIEGFYEYCHYGQDFNDDGWGCAYRSLQSIVSWLRLQGHVRDSIPSHRKIQEALVEVKDKPETFIGSKKWIGSIEIQLILNHWYGLDCRIVNVTSGDQVKDKREDFVKHFEEEKSPIMIGGGVLAWTLLGIAYNENETKYLILDPHYVGEDKRKVIQKKKWIGWQPPTVFKKDTFYNFCCPLVKK